MTLLFRFGDYFCKLIVYIRNNLQLVKFLLIGILILYVFYFLNFRSPADYPINSYYSIKEGSTLSSVASDLKKKNYIKHEFWFKSFVILSKWGSHVVSGDYYFPKRQNVISLALKISGGKYGVIPIRIFIAEGKTVKEISEILDKEMISFDKARFTKLALPKEGYLFPDTYYFLPNASVEEIINTMEQNFVDKIKTIDKEISAFGKPISDIVKMASIIEGEARTEETRRIISGILWKRISINMPLQVDTAFKYINGKNSFTLTEDDLKEDSPYNTYTRRGLPPTPISNPGLMAIGAAINPTKTKYLYFLTDREGIMHYSSTFDEHVANKLQYLK